MRRGTKGRLQAVREEIADLVAALDDVPELAALLTNRETESRVKADVLTRILSGGDELVLNFARLLAEKGRAGEIRAVAAEFEALVAAEERILNVELTTAHELSDDRLPGHPGGHRAEVGTEGAGDAQRRARADRRDRAPGRLAAPRCERARPARPPAHRPGGGQMTRSRAIAA